MDKEESFLIEEKERVEGEIVLVNDAIAYLGENGDEWLKVKLDKIFESYDAVEERISGHKEHISMWEHLNWLILEIEERGEVLIEDEFDNLNGVKARLEEELIEIENQLKEI